MRRSAWFILLVAVVVSDRVSAQTSKKSGGPEPCIVNGRTVECASLTKSALEKAVAGQCKHTTGCSPEHCCTEGTGGCYCDDCCIAAKEPAKP